MKKPVVLAPFTFDLVVMPIVVPLPMRGYPFGMGARWAVPMAGDPDIMTRRSVPETTDPDEIRARAVPFNDHLMPRGRRRGVDGDIY
jgi:hypothetical protein